MITSVMQKLAIDMGYYYDPSLYDRAAPYVGTALAGAGLGAGAGAVLSHGVDRTVYNDAVAAKEKAMASAEKDLRKEVSRTRRNIAPLRKSRDIALSDINKTLNDYALQQEGLVAGKASIPVDKLPESVRTRAAAAEALARANYLDAAKKQVSVLGDKVNALKKLRRSTPVMKTNWGRMGSWAGKGALLGTAGAGAMMLADNLINKDPWNS